MSKLIINNYDQLIGSSSGKNRLAREIVLALIESALRAADPKTAVKKSLLLKRNKLTINGKTFDLNSLDNIYVVGGGKASGAMAETVEEILGERISGGCVNILKGTRSRFRTLKIELVEASHPVPDIRGLEGARRMVSLAEEAQKNDLILCLISGGGSALIPLPVEGVSLEDLQEVNRALLKSGADINSMNAVRKHLSAIKGGNLAKAAFPATIVSLIISDVVGDPLETIASGPTMPDPTTYRDAINVLKEYNIWDLCSEDIRNHLYGGLKGKYSETPKPGDSVFEKVFNLLIATNRMACMAAQREGQKRGLNSLVLTTYLEGEARDVGTLVSGIAKEIFYHNKPWKKPVVVILGGETTVTVRGKSAGRGGRNQELALSAALKLVGVKGVVIGALDSDGIDGFSEAAGAIIDGQTILESKKKGLDASSFLLENNSTVFFKSIDNCLILTGPTGTNVNDLVFIAVI
ncbi:MAG: glycerate kinase type-2 family protein [Candidatus Jordarchaeum sp.]|uniref:glycerate kinase type-2 family protein n=1 Tax=Candidatus Jordarchaeum sp. TaxID=2823881 RepID=UPI004049E203